LGRSVPLKRFIEWSEFTEIDSFQCALGASERYRRWLRFGWKRPQRMFFQLYRHRHVLTGARRVRSTHSSVGWFTAKPGATPPSSSRSPSPFGSWTGVSGWPECQLRDPVLNFIRRRAALDD
jgi:hypothetical protein